MLVFIDESGDAGFDVQKGASPIFAIGLVIFHAQAEANRTQVLIRSAAEEIQGGREFKFNKCSNDRRDTFFQLVTSCDFRIRAIVVEKHHIRSSKLRSEPSSFYNFFLKSVLKFDNDVLRNAKVIVDGSGNSQFRMNLKKYLSSTLPPGSIKSVVMRDSHREPLLQLADMTIGAIARSYRSDRVDCDRWREKLLPKIDNVWNFR